LNGASGSDGQTAGVFSTAPFTIPGGKTVVSLTLPTQTGDPGSAGRIHVFAIASDGARTATPSLAATGTPVATQNTKSPFTADLATVTGGTPATPGAYTARVNWGDGTALTDGTVNPNGSASAVLSGGHTYLKPGDYTVSVTADDGVTSTVTTTSIHVVQARR
jgi:hypothetical protein